MMCSLSKRCGKPTVPKLHTHYSHLILNLVMNEVRYLSANSSRLAGRFGLLTFELGISRKNNWKYYLELNYKKIDG